MPAIGSSIIQHHQGLGQVHDDYIYNSLYIYTYIYIHNIYIYIIYYIYIYIDEQPTLIPLVPCTLCFQTTRFLFQSLGALATWLRPQDNRYVTSFHWSITQFTPASKPDIDPGNLAARTLTLTTGSIAMASLVGKSK
jgi:hypothetical protein